MPKKKASTIQQRLTAAEGAIKAAKNAIKRKAGVKVAKRKRRKKSSK